ncbi:MAG: glycyl-radical enzyme activating protein [Planctomycetes bacterium]|nr:glycyl-radical enzyme activating protein [Planctomycetota bacterium]
MNGAPAGLVFHVQRFSLHDGPGLRSTVFLKGCPLHCLWCHNPESQSDQPEFVRLSHRCMRCGRCSEQELADPVVHGRGAEDADRCPTGALQAIGTTWSVAALAAELLHDRVFFEESGGGVTLSGGEPLAQAAFATALLRALRAEGVHTALDTCGAVARDVLLLAAAAADLVLYDLKLLDEARHRAATGASNRRILDNLQALAAAGARLWIRVPIVPGTNDDAANLRETAAFLAPLRGIERVELLPYHPTGEAKFARLGMECAVRGTQTPDRARLAALAAPFRDAGLTTFGGNP